MRDLLLKPGGLVTTTVNNGQQWDAPNGWAPLQWVAVQGFGYYGQDALARAIGTRFLANVEKLYQEEHKLVEKYVVEGDGLGGGGGGEYALQDGFGWTNGVTLMLLDAYCAGMSGCSPADRPVNPSPDHETYARAPPGGDLLLTTASLPAVAMCRPPHPLKVGGGRHWVRDTALARGAPSISARRRRRKRRCAALHPAHPLSATPPPAPRA